MTVIPSSSIRNGYSFVPCAAPRNLTIRRRRVEIWVSTRWSSTITQSETYSSLAGDRSVAALACDDGGDALVLEPAEKAPELRAEDGAVLEAGEEGLQRIQHDALRSQPVDVVSHPDKEALEVVLPSLLDLAPLDRNVVHREEAAARQVLQVEAHREDVLRQIFRPLLERDEEPGLAVLRRAADQELGREDGLPAARGPRDQGRASERQSSTGDFVEPFDPRGTARKLDQLLLGVIVGVVGAFLYDCSRSHCPRPQCGERFRSRSPRRRGCKYRFKPT